MKRIVALSLLVIPILTSGNVIARPNVVMILADDHPVTAISAYGSRFVSTPHIDRLALQGMRFNNVFCVNSICGPSRSSILTGKYPHVHGMVDNYHKPNDKHVTYPELFKRAGYQTALFGKTHHAAGSACIRGMDHFMISHGAEYHDPKFVEKGRGGVSRYPGYVTDIVTDKALGWLDRRDREEPFLLLVHHPAAHMPFQESEALRDRFSDTVFPEPLSFNDPAKNGSGCPRPFNITIPGGLMRFQGRPAVWGKRAWKAPDGLGDAHLKSWVYQRLMRAFMSCVVSLDDNVGRVLRYLDTHDLTENTIVIYSADQGFFLGEHGWYDKRFMYEESIRMPLIIRGPGIGPEKTHDAMVLNVDFAPTLLALAGLQVPEDMQGASFVPLLSGKTPDGWRTSMYYHFYESRPDSPLPVMRHYGVRTETHKLIRFYGKGEDQWELYDLEKDPHEMRRLVGDPAYAEMRKFLTMELKRVRDEVGDRTGPGL